jgi:hypothetical protein
MDEHPNFDQTKDALVTIFTNCIVALDGVYVCFMVRSFELWDDKKIYRLTPKQIFG